MRAHLRRTLAFAPAVLLGCAPLAGQSAFPHAAHARLVPRCERCHDMEADSPAAYYPAPRLCARCHDGRTSPHVSWSPPSTPTDRHPAHGPATGVALGCTDCHATGGETSVRSERLMCTACHDQHHRSTAHCRFCHARSPRAQHNVTAHAGCARVGCHAPALARGLPFTRETCLLCHRDRMVHNPGQRCGDCHAVGAPTAEPSGRDTSGVGADARGIGEYPHRAAPGLRDDAGAG